MAAPDLRIPIAGFGPLAHALVDEINARRIHPEEAEKRITSAATFAGITVEFRTVQQSYMDTNRSLAKAARPNDVIIASRSMSGFSLDRDLIKAMLFTSGRPVLVIPPYWEQGAEFQNGIIGWDGGARAARAVGDAMPLLTRAELVGIVCVVPDASPAPIWRLTLRDIVRTRQSPIFQRSTATYPGPFTACDKDESEFVGHGRLCAS